MKIAILGTGIVGRTLADRLHEVGHDIVMGTRDPNATLARTGTDARGQVPLRDWLSEHPKIRLAGMSDAAAHGEVIVNALPGVVTLDALSHIDPGAMEGKVLLDTALPLKRHEGLPPTLTGVEELSLAEQIQHAHPGVRVVKSLNTMAAPLMVDPRRVPGDHVVFVTGNDIEAKKTVRTLLKQFGWKDDVIHDLGDVRASRGPEMYAYLLFQLAASFGSFDFNIAINRAASTGADIHTAHEGE
jgi:predicted dinucleotide-binding enzyme